MSSRPLALLAVLCVLGFVATFLVALHTGRGLYDDALLFRHVSGNTALPVRATGAARTLLLGIDAVFVVAALISVVVLAVLQRRGGRALAAVAIVFCSVGTVEGLKHGLPSVPGMIPSQRPPTFPSGHTSIAVSLGLALVLAAPPVVRPAAVLLGAAYAAGIGLSVVLLGWHYPSDVVGSFLIAGFWAATIAAGLSNMSARPVISPRGALVALAMVGGALVVAALLAGRHPAAVAALRSARSVVAFGAVVGVLGVTLFGAFAALVGEDVQ